MKEIEDNFLNSVKAILLYLNVVDINTILYRKTWLELLYEGLNPFQAVITDMDLSMKVTDVRWSKIAEIKQTISDNNV